MAFALSHTTAADGTFSAEGATAWNAGHGATDAIAGGILWFPSTSTVGTSALLAANSLVIGGGAGAAPFTDAALTFNGSALTAGSGGNAVTIGGASVSAVQLLVIGSGGDVLFSSNSGGKYGWGFRSGGIHFHASSDAYLAWTGTAATTSGAGPDGTVDVLLSRIATGKLGVGLTAAGQVTGSFAAGAYFVGATAGADFGPGMPTTITVVKGIITAIS